MCFSQELDAWNHLEWLNGVIRCTLLYFQSVHPSPSKCWPCRKPFRRFLPKSDCKSLEHYRGKRLLQCLHYEGPAWCPSGGLWHCLICWSNHFQTHYFLVLEGVMWPNVVRWEQSLVKVLGPLEVLNILTSLCSQSYRLLAYVSS